MAGAAQVVKVGEDLLGAGHVPGCAFNLHGIGLEVDGDVQPVFHHLQVLIASAEELLDVWDDFNILLHLPCADSSTARNGASPCHRHREHEIALCMEKQVSWPTETRR